MIKFFLKFIEIKEIKKPQKTRIYIYFLLRTLKKTYSHIGKKPFFKQLNGIFWILKIIHNTFTKIVTVMIEVGGW